MRSAGEEPTAVVVVADDGQVTVRCPGLEPGLVTVDALARVALDAGRHGRAVRLLGASAELRALLELVGLAEVLGLEAGGQPELGEQLGEDEVAQPRDAPA